MNRVEHTNRPKGWHRERHEVLHRALDELVADWVTHTEGLPSQNSVMELMSWSHQQTLNPTEKPCQNGH